MKEIEILDLGGEIVTLEISAPLLMIAKDGIKGYLCNNEEITDDAIYSVLNIQQDALNRLENKYRKLIMEAYNVKY